MDLFTYTLTIKDIDTFTTFKKKDAMLRNLMGSHSNGTFFSSWGELDSKNYTEAVLLYKALTYLKNNYDEDRWLLSFIRNYRCLEQLLHSYIVKHTVSYEEFLNIFEHTKETHFKGLHKEAYKVLVEIVSDNKLPFILTTTLYSSSLANSFARYKYSLFTLMEVQVELPKLTYTVIEDSIKALETTEKLIEDHDKILADAYNVVDIVKLMIGRSEEAKQNELTTIQNTNS